MLYTLAQRPLATHETTPAKSDPVRSLHCPEASSLLHLQRTIGNQAVQRMLSAGVDEDRDKAAGANAAGMQSVETQHRYTLSAAIRRSVPAGQHDSTGSDDRDPVIASEAPEARVAAAPPASPAAAPGEGRTVRFSGLPDFDVPAQWDAISTTLTYGADINTRPAPAVLTKFGATDAVVQVNQSSGTQNSGRFDVELVIDNVIRYWVAGGTRKDIASDSDPDITQSNYPTVVSDLTPAAAPVNSGGLTLLKNQSPRKDFWARDLTIKHELFHAADDEKFGRAGAIDARDWLNRQTAGTLDDVERLVWRAGARVADHIKANMLEPAVEQRAYDDGAPDYAARAQAIKAKGLARGYP